ncbi:MAG TPA: glycoside hydrolase family 18 protein, partial [Nitrosopumilaceae archaeon]|nr:glycoside hydrolase family 18 protein [Nitrosopumilaceae archaeon]
MKFRGYGINTKKITLMIFGFWILTSISGFQFIPMTIQTADAVSERIVGYFPYWKSADINSIDYSKLTEIIYFHIWPNSDGSLNTDAININDLNMITNAGHAIGVKVTVAVGGWGVSDGFPLMTQDPTARANFVSNITGFILTNNLDGVDINWETPINQAKIDNQDI